MLLKGIAFPLRARLGVASTLRMLSTECFGGAAFFFGAWERLVAVAGPFLLTTLFAVTRFFLLVDAEVTTFIGIRFVSSGVLFFTPAIFALATDLPAARLVAVDLPFTRTFFLVAMVPVFQKKPSTVP